MTARSYTASKQQSRNQAQGVWVLKHTPCLLSASAHGKIWEGLMCGSVSSFGEWETELRERLSASLSSNTERNLSSQIPEPPICSLPHEMRHLPRLTLQGLVAGHAQHHWSWKGEWRRGRNQGPVLRAEFRSSHYHLPFGCRWDLKP